MLVEVLHRMGNTVDFARHSSRILEMDKDVVLGVLL